MIAVGGAAAAADAKSKIADMEQNNRLAGILVGESIGIVLTTAAGVMGNWVVRVARCSYRAARVYSNDGRTVSIVIFCRCNNGDLNDPFNGKKAADAGGSGILSCLQGKVRPATCDMGPRQHHSVLHQSTSMRKRRK